MSISKHLIRAAFAGAILLAAAGPLAAQNGAQVTRGTITLDNSPERFQIILNRKARLGVIVLVDPSPATDSIGAVLTGVTPNGPAYRAGLRSGDIVTRFNGTLLTQETATVTVNGSVARTESNIPGLRFIQLTAGMSPGDSGTIQYRRGNAIRQATVVVSADPAPAPVPGYAIPMSRQRERGNIQRDTFITRFDSLFVGAVPAPLKSREWTNGFQYQRVWVNGSPLANVELAPLNPELGRYFGTPEGVLVINLPGDSKLGLRPGDVVLAVDGREVRAPGPLLRALMSYEPGETFTFQIVRQRSRLSVNGSITEP